MAEKVFLHVGAPKSGTTFLQTVLWQNRDRLADSGVLIPVRRRFDFNLAAMAVRGVAGPSGRGRAHEVWRRMLRDVEEWPGTAIISCEWFILATAEQAREATAELGSAQVHIIYTARAFDEQVPAAWQEQLKIGAGESLGCFIAGLDQPRERWTWASLDPAVGLERWGTELPAKHAHLVTVPRRGSDPGALWERFAGVCGIDAGSCDTTVAQRNESLGVESARLLQVVGPRLREAARSETPHWTDPYRWIRNYVAHQRLVPRGGSRIAPEPEHLRVLADRARKSRATLLELGVEIVGDIDDLRPDSAVTGRHANGVTTDEMLEIAGDLAADLLERVRHETERAERAERARHQAERSRRAAEKEAAELRGQLDDLRGRRSIKAAATVSRLARGLVRRG